MQTTQFSQFSKRRESQAKTQVVFQAKTQAKKIPIELPHRDFADYHSCEAMPERCSNHKECGPQEECIETLARGFNARSPEWSSRCMQIPFRRCIQVSTGWGVHLFRRFCKMFSESSPGCWAVLQLSCCPSKQGELLENT